MNEKLEEKGWTSQSLMMHRTGVPYAEIMDSVAYMQAHKEIYGSGPVNLQCDMTVSKFMDSVDEKKNEFETKYRNEHPEEMTRDNILAFLENEGFVRTEDIELNR